MEIVTEIVDYTQLKDLEGEVIKIGKNPRAGATRHINKPVAFGFFSADLDPEAKLVLIDVIKDVLKKIEQ